MCRPPTTCPLLRLRSRQVTRTTTSRIWAPCSVARFHPLGRPPPPPRPPLLPRPHLPARPASGVLTQPTDTRHCCADDEPDRNHAGQRRHHRRPLGAVRGRARPCPARAAHPPVRAAGEVRRRPPRHHASARGRLGRCPLLRLARPHRGHRPLRSLHRRQVRNLRH